jgi:hypothetical protein
MAPAPLLPAGASGSKKIGNAPRRATVRHSRPSSLCRCSEGAEGRQRHRPATAVLIALSGCACTARLPATVMHGDFGAAQSTAANRTRNRVASAGSRPGNQRIAKPSVGDQSVMEPQVMRARCCRQQGHNAPGRAAALDRVHHAVPPRSPGRPRKGAVSPRRARRPPCSRDHAQVLGHGWSADRHALSDLADRAFTIDQQAHDGLTRRVRQCSGHQRRAGLPDDRVLVTTRFRSPDG